VRCGLTPLLSLHPTEFDYTYGTASSVHNDEITLQSRSSLEKLSVSFAIAQCTKLSVFESRISSEIDRNKHLPETLARTGSIDLTQNAISREIGRLFIGRYHINLHTEVLDTPEFFWEQDKYRPVYDRLANYLELTKRGELLNRRMDVRRWPWGGPPVHPLTRLTARMLTGLLCLCFAVQIMRELFLLLNDQSAAIHGPTPPHGARHACGRRCCAAADAARLVLSCRAMLCAVCIVTASKLELIVIWLVFFEVVISVLWQMLIKGKEEKGVLHCLVCWLSCLLTLSLLCSCLFVCSVPQTCWGSSAEATNTAEPNWRKRPLSQTFTLSFCLCSVPFISFFQSWYSALLPGVLWDFCKCAPH
jgi:hypothetical protein